MPIFSATILIFTYIQISELEHALSSLAQASQFFCLDLFDHPSKHLPIYKALVCGKSPTVGYESLRSAGLWHILVVSAGHLRFLDLLLKKSSRVIRGISLVGFGLLSGAQPPLIRALIERALSLINQKFKFNLLKSEVILYSSCVYLLLIPSLTTSLSLQLSWLCVLAIHHSSGRSAARQALYIYAFIAPVFLFIDPLTPVSILYNLFLAPVLSLVLFPLSLASILFPKLVLIGDQVIDIVLLLCDPAQSGDESHFDLALSREILWFYILILQTILIFLERRNHGSSHHLSYNFFKPR